MRLAAFNPACIRRTAEPRPPMPSPILDKPELANELCESGGASHLIEERQPKEPNVVTTRARSPSRRTQCETDIAKIGRPRSCNCMLVMRRIRESLVPTAERRKPGLV